MNRSSNLNMYLPENSDHRDVSQLSANFSTLDGSVGALADGLAIVSVGNTHAAIASGQYVYIMNHSSLSEGLYRATSAISANATLSGSNVTAASGGGLNAVNSNVATVNSKIDSTCYADNANATSFTIPLTGYASGHYWVALMYAQTGVSSYGLYIVFLNTQDNVYVTPLVSNPGRTFTGVRSGNTIVLTANDTVWGGIRLLMMN